MVRDLGALIESCLVNKAALARACGISKQALYGFINGEYRPSEAIVAALATHLRVSRRKVETAIAETRRRVSGRPPP